jgi:hypothetical protein
MFGVRRVGLANSAGGRRPVTRTSGTGSKFEWARAARAVRRQTRCTWKPDRTCLGDDAASSFARAFRETKILENANCTRRGAYARRSRRTARLPASTASTRACVIDRKHFPRTRERTYTNTCITLRKITSGHNAPGLGFAGRAPRGQAR